MWVETLPHAKSSFQNLTIVSAVKKKHAKLDIVIGYIYILSNFTVFLYFIPNILLWIVESESESESENQNCFKL